MHIPARSHRPLLAAAAVLVSSLMLVACEGGDSDDEEETPSGPLPTIATYQDDWLQGQCSVVEGVSSAKFLLRATKVNDTTISYTQTSLEYSGTACEGTGVPAGSATPMGSIVFKATEGHEGVTFNRGTWSPPASDDVKTIWALRAPNLLCLMVDTTPTSFPTAKDVADYLAILPPNICYTRS